MKTLHGLVGRWAGRDSEREKVTKKGKEERRIKEEKERVRMRGDEGGRRREK